MTFAMTMDDACETSSSPGKSPAHAFPLYGWTPDSSLSDDENYMDIVFLITRSAKNGQQGHMGALIVRPSQSPQETAEDHANRIFRGILGAATNTPLFGTKEVTSDIHAEIGALGQACRGSHSTEGCTAYITITPCKRCFAALVAFGVKRIVTRQESPKLIRETAHDHNMTVENLSREINRQQMERINRLVNSDRTDEELMHIAERNKLRRQERKLGRRKEDV